MVFLACHAGDDLPVPAADRGHLAATIQPREASQPAQLG